MMRRYAAKLSYELELHRKGVDGMAATYASELGRVLKFRVPEDQYLVDLDDGFYAAQYLRAWIFDAQMRAALREEHGDTWWSTEGAGRFLKQQWSTGQKYTVEELLTGVGYAGLDINPFAEELDSRLAN